MVIYLSEMEKGARIEQPCWRPPLLQNSRHTSKAHVHYLALTGKKEFGCFSSQRFGPEVSERRDKLGLAIRLPFKESVRRPAKRHDQTPPPERTGPAKGYCRSEEEGTYRQTRHLPHLAPFLCDPLVGNRHSHSHGAETVRTCRCQNH